MGSDRHGRPVEPEYGDLERRIKARFAEIGPDISSSEFQEKARAAMVDALQAEIATKKIPPAMAQGLLQFLSLAIIPRK